MKLVSGLRQLQVKKIGDMDQEQMKSISEDGKESFFGSQDSEVAEVINRRSSIKE